MGLGKGPERMAYLFLCAYVSVVVVVVCMEKLTRKAGAKCISSVFGCTNVGRAETEFHVVLLPDN